MVLLAITAPTGLVPTLPGQQLPPSQQRGLLVT